MHLLHLLKLALLAGITVSLWTVRVALTARGRRYAVAIVATAEAIAFATVFAQVLDSVDSPARLAAYGVGVGAGTLTGLAIDQRIAPVSGPVRPSPAAIGSPHGVHGRGENLAEGCRDDFPDRRKWTASRSDDT